jgi:hypothetical protein
MARQLALRFVWRLQHVSEKGGIAADAVVRSIASSSPCCGFVGLGDQLVEINGYRIAYDSRDASCARCPLSSSPRVSSHARCSGLAFKLIQHFLQQLQQTTSVNNVTCLRFRRVQDGIAPPVVVNTRLPTGFLAVPPHLSPLLQGFSTTIRFDALCRVAPLHGRAAHAHLRLLSLLPHRPSSPWYIEPRVVVHFTPGSPFPPPKTLVTQLEGNRARIVEVQMTNAPLGIFFAKGKKVCTRAHLARLPC